VFSLHKIALGYRVAACGFILFSSGVLADLGVSDPTRPIYEQPIESRIAEDGEEAEEVTIDSTIPPLSQLIFSKRRQVAIFGDLIVRAGDETDFGKVVAIRKDRVLIEIDGQVQEVVFSLDDLYEEAIETELTK